MIITVGIVKGGCAKTTTAAALAQAGAAQGAHVLAVDLDPQANLSSVLAADPRGAGSCELLRGEAAPSELAQHTAQGLDVISGAPDLAAEKTRPASARRLRDALRGAAVQYDLIFIDTPPQMGELMFNALYAADGLLIPLEADNASLQGLYQITDITKQIRAGLPALDFLGSVITRYDKRSKINRYMYDAITQRAQEAGAPVIGTIRQGVVLRESQAMRQSLYSYAPRSNAAADYMDLYRAITEGGATK